ncbi:nectin-1-like isoform X2 [Scyliorhinus torazame]|uniref:nectin-1-like isoform X2 n=1 Tax=Scyliorhinus torazame TaxID=75743 RepID=UPI003B596756
MHRVLAMSLVGYVLFLQLVFFTVRVTPKIQIGDLIAGNAGEELKLPCHFPGYHTNVNVVQVVWLKQANPKAETLAVYNPIFGTNYPTTPGRITFHNESSQNCILRIDPLELADEGLYSCEVNVFPTGTHESHINLTVLVKPTIGVVAVPADTRMAEALVATCTAANGKPAADITWMAKVPGTVTSRLTHHPNRTITITSQYRITPNRKANRETLTCLVSHKALRDPVSSVVTLSVQYPPEVSITGYDGNWHINRRNVSLSCIAEANPPATAYHWTMTKGPVSETARAEGKHLYIEQVDYSVNGTWVCEATNVLGKGNGEVTVVVSEVDSLNAGKPFGSTIVYVTIGTVVGILFITAFLSYVIVKKRQRTEDTKAETKPPPAKRNHITVFATLNLNVVDSLNYTRRENCEAEATVNTDVHIN